MGSLIEQQYPSGRVVKNILDNDGDLATVQSKKNASHAFWNYANRFTYNSADAVRSMQLGNGRWESTKFNERLQPTQIALGKTAPVVNGQQVTYSTELLKLEYQYGDLDWDGSVIAGTNNGNLAKQTITVQPVGTTPGFTAVQNYDYDFLNRIQIASETLTPTSGSPETWTQDFRYDRFGNRTFNESTTTTLLKECNGNTEVCADKRPVVNPSANPANNKLNGYTFDAAGNTARDAENRKFTYDAENKQTKVETVDANGNVTGTVGEYWYDGDGKRVKKRAYVNNVLTEETIFVYDASGKLIGEYSNEVASANEAKVAYLTNDQLGSPRINTDFNGNTISRHDYHPFGEEIASVQRTAGIGYAGDTVRKKFTSYERDNETSLDYAKARMFGSSLGRFTSPDPLLISSTVYNPQTWNKYVYVLNNPLAYTDPTGLYVWSDALGGSQSDDELLGAAGDDKAKKKAAQKIIDRRNIFRNGLKAAQDAGPRSDDPAEVARATGSYGTEGQANGVTITFGTTTDGAAAQVGANGASLDINEDGTVRARILVTISDTVTSSNTNSLAEYIGHEGSHNADRQAFANYLQNQISRAGGYAKFFADPDLSQRAFNNLGYNRTVYGTETRAYEVSGLIAQGRDAITGNVPNSSYGGNEVWNRSWGAADRFINRATGADNQVTTSPLYGDRLQQTLFPR